MLLDLDFYLNDLEDKPILGQDKVSKFLARILGAKYPGFDSIKAICLAKPLFQTGKIEIDKADLKILEDGLENTDLSHLAKDAIFSAIEKAKNPDKNDE